MTDLSSTGFTDDERAVDMDGSLTLGRIEFELRQMAGKRRVRVLGVPLATWIDPLKPVTELQFTTDVWTGETWIEEEYD